jgi:hypothetical protein
MTLNNDKYFISWNRGLVAAVFMYQTHLVLGENYIPTTANEAATI